MNNDIEKDAAEPCPFCGAEAQPYDGNHVVNHSDTCFLTHHYAQETWLLGKRKWKLWNTRATAVDKERIAELETRLLSSVQFRTDLPRTPKLIEDAFSEISGMREAMVEARQKAQSAEWSAMDIEFFMSKKDGLLGKVWGWMREARSERDQLRAQLAAKTQECEGLRDDGDLLWKVRKMIARLLVVHTPHLTDDRLVEVIDRMTAGGASLRNRITEYLCVGGLFNPEAMEHDKVRDLLMDVRNYLDSARKEGK